MENYLRGEIAMSLLRNTNFKPIVCNALAESIMDVLTGFDFLITNGEVHKVLETDWKDGDSESQEYTVYTEPRKEE